MLSVGCFVFLLPVLQGDEVLGNGAVPDGKDAMSIFSSAPKSGEAFLPSSGGLLAEVIALLFPEGCFFLCVV